MIWGVLVLLATSLFSNGDLVTGLFLNGEKLRGKRDDGFSVPAVVMRQINATNNGTTDGHNTVALAFPCEFNQAIVVESIKSNCSAYLDPIEESKWIVHPHERWESVERFSNCTYHQIFTQFPHAPDSLARLVWEDGKIQMKAQPNGALARLYAPESPLHPMLKVGHENPPHNFLPIFEKATAFLFSQLAGEAGSSSSCVPTSNGSTSSPREQDLTNGIDTVVYILYDSIRVAAHQYTRCSLQEPPNNVESCTIDTTRKLEQLPTSLFIYGGSPSCNSKAWSFAGVALSILADSVYLAVQLWFGRILPKTSSFSWLRLLIRLVSSLGEPLIQALVLNRTIFGSASAFVIAAMEFLQPTAAPLLAAITGWFLSKGEGFQILTADGTTTALGIILGVTAGVVATVDSLNPTKSQLGLVIIALLLAVGPWVLAYCIIGVFGLSFQLFFILGLLELWIYGTVYCFVIALTSLMVFFFLILFVGLTPVFALWELGWKCYHIRRRAKPQWNAMGENKQEQKDIFPLARHFKQRYKDTKRWKRGLLKTIFWGFIFLSFVSFVGKWIIMVQLLGYAGDAYCPGHYAKATFAGWGFKVGVLGIGLALQYFGLTA